MHDNASIGVAVVACRTLKKEGDTLTSKFTGVTNKGNVEGNYKIVVTRLK